MALVRSLTTGGNEGSHPDCESEGLYSKIAKAHATKLGRQDLESTQGEEQNCRKDFVIKWSCSSKLGSWVTNGIGFICVLTRDARWQCSKSTILKEKDHFNQVLRWIT